MGRGQCPSRISATLNKNQSQPIVATRTKTENTIGIKLLRMRNEYRSTAKPQRNPHLNLTGQGYWRDETVALQNIFLLSDTRLSADSLLVANHESCINRGETR
jgi:hypothetical protein